MPDDLDEHWSVKSRYIAHVGHAATVMGVFPSQTVSNRDTTCFLDHTVALNYMVKGSATEPDHARKAASLHLALAYQRSRVWFEYIESNSNQADESRCAGDFFPLVQQLSANSAVLRHDRDSPVLALD